MAKAIARTKAEIATIKPDSDHHGKFGEATEELDSIVGATEAATSDILAAAEQIQEVAWTLREQGLEPEVCDFVDARATDIYTACSFQDLTGQRTRKVIQVMRYLEDRINAMIDIWGLDSAMAAEAGQTAQAHRAEAARLSGPSRRAHELDQADVDVVMGPVDRPWDGAGARINALIIAPVPQLAAPVMAPPEQAAEPTQDCEPDMVPAGAVPWVEAPSPALIPAESLCPLRRSSKTIEPSRADASRRPRPYPPTIPSRRCGRSAPKRRSRCSAERSPMEMLIPVSMQACRFISAGGRARTSRPRLHFATFLHLTKA
jgi:hypothetical protein